MEHGVERLAALVLLLTSLSHIAAPAVWRNLFDSMRAKGDLAGLANASIHLPLGLIIVAFHDIWRWPQAVVTLVGWLLLIKGSLHLIFPQLTQRTLAIAGEGRAAERNYRVAGLAMLPLALFVGWIAIS